MTDLDITSGANYVAALNLDGNQMARLKQAALSLGVSDEDAAKMIFRAKRRAERRGQSNTQIDQVFDQLASKQAKVDAINVDMPPDIDDKRTIPNREVEYGEFGNQDELQNFGGINDQGNVKNVEQAQQELERARGKRDPNVLSRVYFEKGKEGPQREELYIPDGMPVPARFVEAAKNRDFGIYQEGVAAPGAQVQRIERDALQQGVDIYGADAFPGAVDVIGRINDNIQGNRSSEQSLVREMVMRDRQRQNAEMVEANNWRAQAAANLIGQDFAIGGRGAAADQAIENIGQIAELGPAKVAYDFQVSQNPVDRGTAIPNALPLNLPDQYNSPITDNRYAGPLQRQEQWLVDAIPGYREQGAFGNYPDVGINEQISLARAAIQNAKIKGQTVDLGDMQIRGLMDLQEAANQVINLGRQNNQPFFNQVDGKNIVNRNPGIGEVLERGGMNARQVGDVAKAMFALEAARRNPLNRERKEAYFGGESVNLDRPVEFGGYHPALGGGEAKIAMLGREKVGGREVKAQLRKLDGRKGNPGEPLNAQELALARMPFQGGVADQEIKRAKFVRGADRHLNREGLIRKYGPENGNIAADLIDRREQQAGVGADGFGMRGDFNVVAAPEMARVKVPDPWQIDPATGPGMGGGGAPPVPPSIAVAASAPEPERRISTGPTQGPRTPGIRQKIMNSIKRAPNNFSSAPRYQRYGAVGGGALLGVAGLDGLINGERDRREEEQYR